jgi:hypothetical protein
MAVTLNLYLLCSADDKERGKVAKDVKFYWYRVMDIQMLCKILLVGSILNC